MAPRPWLPALFFVLWVKGAAVAAPDDGAPFEITTIPATDRIVVAEIADLDGDGRADLLTARFEGIPPADRRTLRIRFQPPSGEFPVDPNLTMLLPAGAAAYDIADVLPSPGVEILILSRMGISIYAFDQREPRLHEVPVPAEVTAGMASDERGLSRLPLATHALGNEPVLVVPGQGEAFLLSPFGELRARLDVGARANYFVQPQGLIYAESDIQLFFDVPRISLGDIDGDGLTDVLSSARHELRVFLQRPDGSFASAPDRRISLGLVSIEDHMRGSGAVRSAARDIDGDGRLDLMISSTSGGLTNADSTTSIYFNKDGAWELSSPDFSIRREKRMGADQLIDADGDGRLELLQGQIPLTVLELAEVILTSSFDAHIALYRITDSKDAEPKAWFERKFGLPINFDTGRLRGFVPSFEHDLNGDGSADFLHSTDGSAIEVYLTDAEGPFRQRAGRQDLDAEGTLRSGDVDGDGLIDFVLCNPRRPNRPILILRNRGILPGTPPSMRTRDAPS